MTNRFAALNSRKNSVSDRPFAFKIWTIFADRMFVCLSVGLFVRFYRRDISRDLRRKPIVQILYLAFRIVEFYCSKCRFWIQTFFRPVLKQIISFFMDFFTFPMFTNSKSNRSDGECRTVSAVESIHLLYLENMFFISKWSARWMQSDGKIGSSVRSAV